VALPPAGWHDGREPVPLIIAWHLNDPPRSAAAMASALPLAEVAAWRVYLDLPMHGRRQAPGGLEEFMRLGYQDAVLKAFEPQVTQAAAEFPAVLAELRTRLPVTGGPIGVVGASAGALPAQLVIAGGAAPVSTAALISPVIQLAEVVAANERRFGVSYPWSDASRAVAARLDFVARAGEIAARASLTYCGSGMSRNSPALRNFSGRSCAAGSTCSFTRGVLSRLMRRRTLTARASPIRRLQPCMSHTVVAQSGGDDHAGELGAGAG